MTSFVSGTGPQVSLTNQSATTASPGGLDNACSRANHALFVSTGAGVSAGVVSLQLSADNVNWFTTTATITTAAANTQYAVALASFPAQYVRAAITTNITGGTISATVASA